MDGQSIEEFETDLKSNLYKIWNRMSSGSLLAATGATGRDPQGQWGLRPLGIPTVGDRVAQMVAKMDLEPEVEPLFHADWYGYRPGQVAR